jgi:hypothetical protein
LIRNATAGLFTLLALPAFAQDTQSLAREAKNLFADLINLQFFYDATLQAGPADQTQQVLTLQPLIPFNLPLQRTGGRAAASAGRCRFPWAWVSS